ncbi:SDR family oxidoreductase [Allokutzneria sp. A3M-2-11 16]|uniref:SDR family NAD(P)-dependent oxidoreductase n=1 Tax=Allokutzneria sp. A3M-2-11 16 TaxID=2962043 RepID=UPI0020B802DD|nr:SDR family NAD(P)-dependent oxidoreductase [Allokutzneria sp. A3M-2-11 16]MCP3801187.1 SDR family oxidoreductase [Allokutzneria sp. A3M-2-11 16]
MSFDLTGKRALVTGAGHGIGAAVALALAGAGADVIIHYGRSEARAVEVAAEVELLGRKALALGADVTVSAEVDRLLSESATFLGGLDIVVCNAGHLVGRVSTEDMTDEHFERVVAVNLTATFRTCRAAIPYLKAAGGGRIVTMSSLAASNGGGPGAAAYSAAKAGVAGFTRALAKELAPSAITVNALAPGFIGGTEFHGTFTPEDSQRAIVAGIPLKRAGTAHEVAAAALFLASPEAGYLTGATIDIDGGAWFR